MYPLDGSDARFASAGRTFHQCFLRKLIAERDHCPPSYDVANFSRHEQLPAFHTCKIMASHEDYSTVPPLQAFRKPAVITQLRDPVDRVLSSYEFARALPLNVTWRERKPVRDTVLNFIYPASPGQGWSCEVRL